MRGGFFSPVKRRIVTASSGPGVGIVVSPDKKATLAEAAAKAENILDNDAKAKTAVSATPATTTVTSATARQSPLRNSTAVASPRAKRAATPTATPNKKRAAATTSSTTTGTGTPSGAVVPVAESASAAAELAQSCLQAESTIAAKNAEIERLELEFFHALFLALKLSLTEQKARFNNKIDAADLLASARRQNVPFTTAALTAFIDRQLRVATRANSRQSVKK